MARTIWRFEIILPQVRSSEIAERLQIFNNLPVMAPLQTASLVALILLGFAHAKPTKIKACANIAPKINPTVASGYTARVVINGLKTPRGIVFDSAGNLLVVEQGGGGVRRVVLTDNGGTDVCVASSKTLIADATVCVFYILPVPI